MYETLVRHTTSGAAPGGVHAEGLGKRFGELWAVAGLDLAVAPGTILGLLGHNGAGKTTAIRMLTTLSRPTTGTATVAGFDVVTQAGAVRRAIGVAAQQATVDGLLDGRLNLELIGRLHGLPRKDARRRADALLAQFDLEDAATRLVKTYSGGMRRRLDLAASLVASPSVLFLDEPTTGLDPLAREGLWRTLRELVRDGTTLILTTQYLEEADRLADDVVVLDHGRAVAHGTPAELKARIGGDRLEVTLPSPAGLPAAAAALARFAAAEPAIDPAAAMVTVPVLAGTRLVDVVRTLDDAAVDVTDVHRREATLDDVFLSLTTTSDHRERTAA
jgi:daunorubicin resistance ABC transporter ATP-binding subunit